MDTFSHLFGYSGVILRHTGQLEDGSYMAFEDYYTVTEEGTPLLLASEPVALLRQSPSPFQAPSTWRKRISR